MRPGPAPGRVWKALTAAAESRRLTANAALRALCGPAIAIEEPHDVDAYRRSLDLRQLAALDEYRHRDVRLCVRCKEHEPRMRRQVEPAAAPLRGAGLASAIRGHAGRSEPVVHVVGTVDLLAHPFTNGL